MIREKDKATAEDYKTVLNYVSRDCWLRSDNMVKNPHRQAQWILAAMHRLVDVIEHEKTGA
jgi:hypothetical protein